MRDEYLYANPAWQVEFATKETIVNLINTEKLESTIADAKSMLKDGLLTVDVWERKTGLSLAGFNTQPVAVALFTQVMESLDSALQQAAFPAIDRYAMFDMKDGHIVVIINHGELLQGLLMNNKVNLGIVLSVVVPNGLKGIAEAQQG